MAISKIQYDDKVAINIDSTIPDINKCNASDLNEIKSVVNNNADEIPTISDEYGTSTTDGYAQNYINENTINPSGEPSTSEEDVSSATFTNTLEAPMNIDLKGNTLQNGTPTPNSPIPVNNVSGDNDVVVCGKNLFNPMIYDTTASHSNCTADITNTTINVIPAGNSYLGSAIKYPSYVNDNNKPTCIEVKPSTKYTFSINNSGNSYVSFIDSNYQAVNTVDYPLNNLTSYTFTTPSNCKYVMFRLGKNSGTTPYTFENIQLEENETATTYEAYNGTTYNIDLPVENLFDKTITSKRNSNASNSQIINGIKISPAGNNGWCLWLIKDVSNYVGKKFSTRATFNGGKIAFVLCDANGYNLTTGVDTSSSDTNLTYTIPTLSSATYLALQLYGNSNNTNEVSFTNIIVCEGETSSPYTPYGTTPIELNKIGTYQDYIYKENDKWYLHKEIDSIVLDGSETIGKGGTTRNQYFYADVLSNYIKPIDNDTLVQHYSDYFINKTPNQLSGGSVVGSAIRTDNSIGFAFGLNSEINTTDKCKTWLEENTPIFYYILATPTNTEITYTPLIEQLESIKNAMSKKGTTNVNQVNNDLPFILDLSVFNDTYNGRYESLVEQIPNNDNLVNVGTYVNDNYKVNMLYNKNLCSGISQKMWLSGSGNECGIAPSSAGLYIKVSGGNYTISTIQTQARYRVSCIDTLPTSNQSVTGYNGVGKDGTSDTITIDTTGHNYLVVDATDVSKIQIEKGNTATTFEVQKYSINVDTNEVYVKPVSLYENPNGTNGNITLSDDSNNYEYIEIYYGSGDGDIISTRTQPGRNFLLSTIDARTSVSQLYIRSALKNITGTSLTNIVFSNVVNYGTMKITTSTNEFRNLNTIKIYRVLGYK